MRNTSSMEDKCGLSTISAERTTTNVLSLCVAKYGSASLITLTNKSSPSTPLFSGNGNGDEQPTPPQHLSFIGDPAAPVFLQTKEFPNRDTRWSSRRTENQQLCFTAVAIYIYTTVARRRCNVTQYIIPGTVFVRTTRIYAPRRRRGAATFTSSDPTKHRETHVNVSQRQLVDLHNYVLYICASQVGYVLGRQKPGGPVHQYNMGLAV